MLLGDPRQADQRTQSFPFPIVIHQSQLDPAARALKRQAPCLHDHMHMHSSTRQAQNASTCSLGRRDVEVIICMITRDFSVISNDVTGVSLSLCYSQKSLTHNIGSASALPIIRSAEALPILCERYIRWERERDTEREREKDGSDVTIVALKLAMSFALLLAKNVHLSIGEEFCAFPCQKNCTSVSPLLNGAEFTLSVAKNVALFETVRILRTVKWRDWQGIEAAKQTIEFPAAPFFFLVEKIEKMNQINTKNYWK